MSDSSKTRIAILGGGMGALSAAYALTSPHNPQAGHYEITVYQIGFRLGGKGASGRSLDPSCHGRIEEHGLHNLFGFYENTFQMMREVYRELREKHGIDRGDFMDAVAPENAAIFVEEIEGVPRPWHIYNPANDRIPGDGSEGLSLAETVKLMIEFLELNMRYHDRSVAPPMPSAPKYVSPAQRAAVDAVVKAIENLLRFAPHDVSDQPFWVKLSSILARVPRDVAIGTLSGARRAAFLALSSRMREDGPRRLWIAIHFATSILIGFFAENIFAKGLDALNSVDFREWLERHTMDDGGILAQSVLLRVMYDSSFAYRAGNTARNGKDGIATAADYEAGTLLAGLFRAAFTYKGAFGWKMRGGTGDVLIAPLFELLRARGVRFEFFHRVDEIVPAKDGSLVERVVMTIQAQTKTGHAYEPLFAFENGRCWPNRPLWEQLEGGDLMRRDHLDLEDPRANPALAKQIVLEHRRDFDEIVFGISMGAVPILCRRLIEQNLRWRTAAERVKTTRTQSLQVWLRPGAPIPGHGPGHGRAAGQPITGFWYDEESPLNVWADMSHLISLEQWSGIEPPGHLSYYVSPMPDEPEPHEEAGDRVRRNAERVLAEAATKHLRAANVAPFDWSHLVDHRPGTHDGATRLDAQYWRANTYPSERYVLSVAASTEHRLPPHSKDDYRNLYLAGDWTRNGMNCGAMESAVMGGLLCARALSGFPSRVVGTAE